MLRTYFEPFFGYRCVVDCLQNMVVDMDFVHPIAAVIPGAQGRVLEVLVETTAELNLRTLAKLSGVSVAQASRVLPELVELGLVERREVPPSSQFRLARTNVAVRALLELAAARDVVLTEIGRIAKSLAVPPVSVIVFGSFARGEARRDSDLDVVFVRPTGVDEEDESWTTSIEQWRSAARSLTGNPIEILEIGADAAASRLYGSQQVWRDMRRDGRVVHGMSIDELAGVRVA